MVGSRNKRLNSQRRIGLRIEFKEEGGIGYFPGLRKPVTIDLEQLDKADAEKLQRLIKAARFFELPATLGVPARGAADYQTYILSVEDSGRRHTVRILAPVKDPALNDLVQTIQKYVKAARAGDR